MVSRPGATGFTSVVRARLRKQILELVAQRASICPSDAARAVDPEGWRALMDDARDVARELARAGEVEVTQRGEVLEPDGEWRGPIRIQRLRRGNVRSANASTPKSQG